MKIGIIGLGAVGSVLLKVFKKLGNTCFGLDLKNIKQKENLLSQDILYICVPTNFNKNGLNIKIINFYLFFLNKSKYSNPIVIKSTLNPGDTDNFKKKYKHIKKYISYVPEFLRERSAFKDFTKNHDLLLIGSNHKSSIRKIIKNHGKYPKKIKVVKPIEAEFVKLYSNSYNAARIVFANCFYEITKKFKVNYKNILNAYLLRKLSTGNYLNCNETLRGFGGKCLPKDLKALNLVSKKKVKKVKFFNDILNQNNLFKITTIK